MEPIAISSIINQTPPTKARSPTQREPALEVKEDEKAAEEKKPDSSRLRELLEDVQKDLNIIHNVDLQFSVHEASGELMVTIIDGSTGEFIREVPPSEILDLAAKMDEMIGLMFDQRC